MATVVFKHIRVTIYFDTGTQDSSIYTYTFPTQHLQGGYCIEMAGTCGPILKCCEIRHYIGVVDQIWEV